MLRGMSNKPNPDMSRLTGTPPGTLLATLDIRVTEASPERVVATMPVGPKVHQPFGILHGGASVVLAETVASIGATLNVGAEQRAVGLEINANHIRAVGSGLLTGTATPLHRGRSTHVWQVEIRSEEKQLVCTSRCTLAIITARD